MLVFTFPFVIPWSWSQFLATLLRQPLQVPMTAFATCTFGRTTQQSGSRQMAGWWMRTDTSCKELGIPSMVSLWRPCWTPGASAAIPRGPNMSRKKRRHPLRPRGLPSWRGCFRLQKAKVRLIPSRGQWMLSCRKIAQRNFFLVWWPKPVQCRSWMPVAKRKKHFAWLRPIRAADASVRAPMGTSAHVTTRWLHLKSTSVSSMTPSKRQLSMQCLIGRNPKLISPFSSPKQSPRASKSSRSKAIGFWMNVVGCVASAEIPVDPYGNCQFEALVHAAQVPIVAISVEICRGTIFASAWCTLRWQDGELLCWSLPGLLWQSFERRRVGRRLNALGRGAHLTPPDSDHHWQCFRQLRSRNLPSTHHWQESLGTKISLLLVTWTGTLMPQRQC